MAEVTRRRRFPNVGAVGPVLDQNWPSLENNLLAIAQSLSFNYICIPYTSLR
jgi:hypothetical protein